MKTKLSINQFSMVLLLLVFASCSKDKETEDPLDKDYTGTLRFEYSRSFPAISIIIDMNVELFKSGDMLISQPSGQHYDVTDEEPQTVKIRETGDVVISSLSGEYKVINDTPRIIINANTLIDGTMTVWGWDDEYGWVNAIDIPFSLTSPVSSPMNFDFINSTASDDIIGATVPAYNGTVTAKWILGLMPNIYP